MTAVKQLLVILLILFMPCLGLTQVWNISVMTFNIRYNNPQDGIYSWAERKSLVKEMLRQQDPDIIACQEVLKDQLGDLVTMMKPYAAVGVGRDDGKNAGEFAPVLYNPIRFTLKNSGTFWLSETPEVPGSKSWNAACTRIATWAKFKDSESGRILFVFNTHFDHISELARNESARLLLSAIDQVAGKHWVIVTGDFNATKRSEMYRILTTTPPEKALLNTERISRNEPSGPDYTFIGFPFSPEPGNTIDFIFTKNTQGIVVTEHTVVTFHTDDKYPSDHLPVQANFEIKKTRK